MAVRSSTSPMAFPPASASTLARMRGSFRADVKRVVRRDKRIRSSLGENTGGDRPVVDRRVNSVWGSPLQSTRQWPDRREAPETSGKPHHAPAAPVLHCDKPV